MGKKIYGVVEQNKNVFFVLDGFQCTFLYNSNSQNINGILLNQKDGFILGRIIGETNIDRFIYIYTKTNIELVEEKGIITDLYFISSNPYLDNYLGIQFKGGVLKKLFTPAQWNIGHYNDAVSIEFAENQERHTISNKDFKGYISVGTGICGRRSIEEGSSLSTTPPELELVFEKEKGLVSFPEILKDIVILCQFMAFRKNIHFDEINLMNPDSNKPKSFNKIASCYFKFDEPSDISKRSRHCISFNVLGERIDNLLNCIVEGKNSEETNFSINFVPKTDNDVNFISSMRIREIFSALEAELDINKVKCQTGIEFDNLIKRIEMVVKEHQAGETPLDDQKDYDYIYGTLGHMYGSLANRIYKFMQENKSLINGNLNKTQIETLVKYRNTITHGGFLILDIEKGMTALTLISLIYCSILKRIGLDDEEIKQLFAKDILS